MTQSYFLHLQAFTAPVAINLTDHDLLGDPEPTYVVLAQVDDQFRGSVPQCQWRVVFIGHEDNLHDIFCAQLMVDREALLASGPAIDAFDSASELTDALMRCMLPISVSELDARGMHSVGFDAALCDLAAPELRSNPMCPETPTGRPALRIVDLGSVSDIATMVNTALLIQRYLAHRVRRHIQLSLPRVLDHKTPIPIQTLDKGHAHYGQ